jgi:hypothetical protein
MQMLGTDFFLVREFCQRKSSNLHFLKIDTALINKVLHRSPHQIHHHHPRLICKDGLLQSSDCKSSHHQQTDQNSHAKLNWDCRSMSQSVSVSVPGLLVRELALVLVVQSGLSLECIGGNNY